MSEIVATLPQGTQVVVEANLLTSDVDHTIEEVRQEVQQQQNGGLPGGGASRSSNRTLFCRKCEGHGQQVVLKGHASRCPYNNCQCKTCTNVMSMRANAIIRRYRTRTLEGGLVLKPVHFKNGNTRLRVFPKYVDDTDALPIPTSQRQMSSKGHMMPDQGILIKPITSTPTPITSEQQQQQQQQRQPQQPQQQNHQQTAANFGTTGSPSMIMADVQPTSQQTQQQQQNQQPTQQAPFPVKRSYSDELVEMNRLSGSPKTNSMDQSPCIDPNSSSQNILNGVSLPVLQMIAKQQEMYTDLLSSGLLSMVNQSTMSTLPTTPYDNSNMFGSLVFPNSTSSMSQPAYNNQVFTTASNEFNSINENERKMSDAALLGPAAAQLSELNIGVTTNSPIHPINENGTTKLTPSMFESSNNDSMGLRSGISVTNDKLHIPEPFTSNLMIAPTADRSHPLFRKFLNTVRELEKQMLTDCD